MKNCHLSFLLLVFLFGERIAADFEVDVAGEMKIDQDEIDLVAKYDFSMAEEEKGLTSSCASITDCGTCSNMYTCHWCSHDNSCHVKGSWHGCSWGATCEAPKPVEGCASQKTCSECALSSYKCHWCDFDNACHAIGSPHGCTVGVDCYSNDRCRRKEPKKYEQEIITEMPMGYVGLVVFVTFVLTVSISWCFRLLGSICGSYREDESNVPISRTTSVAGMSLTGMPSSDPSYTALETDAPEENLLEQGENNSGPTQQIAEEGAVNETRSTINEGTDDPVHALDVTGSSGDYVQMADNAEGNDASEVNETAFLLDPPGIVRTATTSSTTRTGPRQLRKMSRTCRMCSILSTLLVLLIASLSIYFFPVIPTFSVCNDSIGWRRVVEHIIAMRIDASFEVLVSLSNKNRIAVALDHGSGIFQFDGRPLGTFVIPPLTVESMAISDLMILAKASPDRHQAIKIVQAFRNGHLILDADFNATIRLPWLFNYTQNITVHDYQVDITAPKDRTLCQCPTWDDSKNNTPGFLLDLIPDLDVDLDLTIEDNSS